MSDDPRSDGGLDEAFRKLDLAFIDHVMSLKALVGDATVALSTINLSADTREANAAWIDALCCLISMVPADQQGPAWISAPDTTSGPGTNAAPKVLR